MRRFRKRSKRQMKDKRGSALLMAMFSVSLLMMIATEILYETTVEYLISSQSVNQLKAYYAAKSGTELSLLRINIYKKALAQFGDSLPDKSLLEPIWQLPFAWPPVLPDDISRVDREEIESVVKNSALKATYLVTIETEGSKIDINDLASPSKVMAETTKKQLLEIFNNRLEANDAWSEEYRGYDFERLINNIADWVDEDSESRNGGDEGSNYTDLQATSIPPNQPFKTIQELHLVRDMTDGIYDVLEPRITVFGSKGISVNHASKEVLQSLDPQITDEIAQKIIEGREDPNRGPFKNLEDFVGYLNYLGIAGNPFVADGKDPKKEAVPLIFDAEYNFRIRSTGVSGKVTREIIAIVYDFDKVKERLGEFIEAENKQPDPNQGQPPGTGGSTDSTDGAGSKDGKQPQNKNENKQAKTPKERPNVVYWMVK